MLFNSIEFAIFLPTVFLMYWFLLNKRINTQNIFLIIVSYIFYGWWDWRFLTLIFISSATDYILGQKISKSNTPRIKKLLLSLSIAVNLGMLVYFKYANFFIHTFISSFESIGIDLSLSTINIILPVGISFYTFQTLSYTIDVYKGKIKATDNIYSFFAFVSFFPQLVAGPIERASNLLPQFNNKRHLTYHQGTYALKQILNGLFKKIVIADNCAIYVNDIFANYAEYSGSTLFFGGVLFAFQIYGDFSGYSDIAIGTARLFGFNLMTNFSYPYFSRNIAEFWKRWHISLSTWFRDYLYIPIGGNRVPRILQIRNILIVFIVSGFWHGAKFTFIFWGLIHALIYLPQVLLKRNKNITKHAAENSILPSLKEVLQILKTFAVVVVGWIFFRADSLSDAFNILIKIFSKTFFTIPEILPKKFIILLVIFIFIEWIQRKRSFALDIDSRLIPKYVQVIVFYIVIYLTFLFETEQQDFIYFQF